MKRAFSIVLAIAFLAAAPSGVAQERDSLSRYLDRDIDPAIMLEGNYRVSRGMLVPGAPFPERVTLIRHMEYDCDTGLDHPRCSQGYLTNILTGDGGWSLRGRPGGELELDAGRVAVDWEYGVPGESILMAGADRNLYGVWQDGETASAEIWTRVEARPDRWSIGVADRISGPLLFPGADARAIRPINEPMSVEAIYSEGWSVSDDARGARPTFQLNLFGDDMWGVHYVGLTGPAASGPGMRSGLERRPFSFICEGSNGTIRQVTDWWTCVGGSEVTGISVPLVIWPETVPGRYILWLDGTSYPFDLRVEGWVGDSACAPEHFAPPLSANLTFGVFDSATAAFLAGTQNRFNGLHYQGRRVDIEGFTDVMLSWNFIPSAPEIGWLTFERMSEEIAEGRDISELDQRLGFARDHFEEGLAALNDADRRSLERHRAAISEILTQTREFRDELRDRRDQARSEYAGQRHRLRAIFSTRDRATPAQWDDFEFTLARNLNWTGWGLISGVVGSRQEIRGSTQGVRSTTRALNVVGGAFSAGETLVALVTLSLEMDSTLEAYRLIRGVIAKMELLAIFETGVLPRFDDAIAEIEFYRDQLVLLEAAGLADCDWRERWEANGG